MNSKSKLILYSREIKKICEPFFQKLQLDHLNYICRENTGHVTYLCSNSKWLDHYLKMSYPKIGAFENNPDFANNNYILWSGLKKNDPILIDSKEMIGVEFGITLIKSTPNRTEFYNLGKKSSDPSIINQYINNLDQYERFIWEFNERAASLFKAAKNERLLISDKTDICKRKKQGLQSGKLHFTERELQCIKYLILGKTAEEISIILAISKRTIETHITNLKRKLDCYNQFRLGYLLGQLDISVE